MTGLDICDKCFKSAYVAAGKEDFVRNASTDPEMVAMLPFEYRFTCADCVSKEALFH